MTRYNITIGQKFNEWTVIDNKEIRRKGFAQFKVKCSCGNEKYIDAYALIYGKSKKCFKCNSRKLEDNPQWRGFGNVPGKMFSRCKRGAKNRDLEFSITIEDINAKFMSQNARCKLSDLPISFKDNTASIDRIDSSKGYTVDNIQIVHKDINLMKNHFTESYFVEVCTLIAERNKNAISK